MTAAPRPDSEGFILATSGGRWWAWYGVHITAANDLTLLAEYRQMDRGTRSRAVLEADRDYLAAQLGADNPVELRWTSVPSDRRVQLHVLGVAVAGGEGAVVSQARAARARLLAVPRHVTAEVVTDRDELSRLLQPAAISRGEGAELRKRWIVEKRQREDAPWTHYVSSPWLRELPTAGWDALIRALAASPTPVVLSVGLQPMPVPADLRARISKHAAVYRRLSEAGQAHSVGLFRDDTQLNADPGAVTAGQLFQDAGQRYLDRAFRLRVSLAAEGPLPAALLAQVGEVMSPAEGSDERGFRSAELAGKVLEEVRPTGPEERRALVQGLSTLGHTAWGRPRVPAEAAALAESLRPLGELVDVREATAVFRLPVAPDGHLEGFPVARPRATGLVETPADLTGSVLLGRQPTAAEPQPIVVPVTALTSHTLVVGSTGSGKTSSVLNLLEQLWATHHVPFLVIEPVNADRDDYRWLLERPGFEKMLVLTVGDESLAPLRLNPFEVPAGVRVGTYLASLVSCFDAAFGLTGPLPFLYRKALKAMYTRVGISPDEVSAKRHVGRWPRLRDLAAVFAELPDIDRYAGEVRSNISAASRLRIESLLSGSCGRTIDAPSSYPIDELLSRPVVLELAAVGDDDREQALIIALLLNALTAHYKASRTSSDLQHVTVIEEAHRLLRRPRPTGGEGGEQSARAAEQFANTLAENRKYGEGLVIVEQVPSKLIEDALKNTTTKVMHHLPSPDDREAVAATMNLTEDQETFAQALDPMTAFVAHRGMRGRAGLVDIIDVRGDAARAAGIAESPLPGSDVVRERYEGFIAEHTELWDDLAPYPDCGGCRHRCQFRGIGEVTAPATKDVVRKAVDRRTYPTVEAEKHLVWLSLVDRFRRLAADYPEFDRDQKEDLAACSFMHAAFEAFPGKRVAWLVDKYRATAGGAGAS